MKAAIFNALGSAEDVLVISEVEEPSLAHGEVLVRIHRSAVNPSDVKKRAGAFPDLLNDGFIIPHSDGAGVIEAVGHGVPFSRIGERVWVYQAQYARRFGTAAEYVALPTNRAVVLPDSAGFDDGACNQGVRGGRDRRDSRLGRKINFRYCRPADQTLLFFHQGDPQGYLQGDREAL